ncbi:MAG: hypothetical protein LBQ45_01905 [Mycoplasmataceae bacterium]|nr:hypothetical protein [Mycoplasmataceae bacterium]
MWGKKKNTEKKSKWWKSNESDDFSVALGSSYKVVRGLMIVVMAGLILVGISTVFRTSGDYYNNDAWKGLLIAGSVIAGSGMIGVFAALLVQVKQNKLRDRNDKKKIEMRMKLAEAEKKYRESQKHIVADNKRLDELKKKQDKKRNKLD